MGFSIVRCVLTAILLVVEGISDIKKREILLAGPIIAAALSVILLVSDPNRNIPGALLGLAEGFVIIVFSFITNEAIGLGDGVILCATGLLLGWKDNLFLFFWACLLCAVFSFIALIFRKADKKTKIPFVPFMAPALLITVLLRGG